VNIEESPMTRSLALLVCTAVVLATVPAGLSAAAQGTPVAATTSPVTALLVSATGAPRSVTGSDGMEHTEYDLIITNAFTAPVTLSTVEVTTLDGQLLLRLEGEALVAVTQPLLGMTPTEEVPVSGTVAVMIDVVTPPGDIPDRLTHRIAYELPPDALFAAGIGSREISGPVLDVDLSPPFVLVPPLHGPGWLNFNSCCDAYSVHRSIRLVAAGERFTKSETFAIDWVLLQNGQPFAGDGSRNEDWFGYGAEVTAAAAGTVVAVRDGLAEETPNMPPVHVDEAADFGGNHVMVEIAPGVWAFYAHLQPGSVAVAVGDEVAVGDPIGLLGNSGNSTAPHLHFGLLDAPDALTADSVPMVFDHYTLTGIIDPAALAGQMSTPSAGTATPAAPVEVRSETQTDTLPLNLTVVEFP
jgi:murein DD-endopeptidase MepM/ murein hydrolase activator NlpD